MKTRVASSSPPTITSTLGLAEDALELTWRSLAEVGNLSSSSVLHVLRDTRAKKPTAAAPVETDATAPAPVEEPAAQTGKEDGSEEA